MADLTHARLMQVLRYDPLTGDFFWRVRPSQAVKMGDIAGTVASNGYISIGIDGKIYAAHRLAWFYMVGVIPLQDIDHEDTDGLNNRWTNLREATEIENAWNRPKPSNNTSGVKGVNWSAPRNKWIAELRANGKRYYLGGFAKIDDAARAVREFRKSTHGAFTNHGA
jgi:hypothetical protein